MKIENNREKSMSDEKLRQLLKSYAPQIPGNPWFTRKVLNRLPEKRKRLAGRIEMALCFVALAATVFFGVKFVMSTMGSSTITVGDLFFYIVYLTFASLLTYNVVAPFVLRRPKSSRSESVNAGKE